MTAIFPSYDDEVRELLLAHTAVSSDPCIKRNEKQVTLKHGRIKKPRAPGPGPVKGPPPPPPQKKKIVQNVILFLNIANKTVHMEQRYQS